MCRQGRGAASRPVPAQGEPDVSETPTTYALPPVERPNAWTAHRAAILAGLAPVGAVEQQLAEQAALCLWRLARAARYERAMLSQAQAEAPSDLAHARYAQTSS